MSQEESQVADQHSAEAAHTGHPTPATYFKVAMALSILTAIEVGIFYVTQIGYAIIPVLAILSVGKFALVVMYYMHLKFDSKIFSGMFFFGMFVATGVIFALMALFSWFLF
ncbi:MAG: cytochrome C oxidase subunit IV family protein [Dehalococcoidia bacterium]|nr:cytochrome C oxidase subunit IV family protein [Dehalococcoidia bacterium]MXY20672.1 cytochrome C oxidase subunit IV family protein [Dehalococcoidia bacterium]MYA62385.1 cytochrome C oxidase subunit IV family protein [Dehalococcoidia bacterium]